MKSKLAVLGGSPIVDNAPHLKWPPITGDDVARVVELMQRNELSYYGREGQVEQLEDGFKRYLGLRYALATSSGTAALHSAFFAVGIEPGDEVLAPTYTFLATVMPILVANGIPILVDAESDTGNVDPTRIERHITHRAKAIVVTHMWGNPVDMDAIARIAHKHGLKVIEDCSHAHGAVCNDQLVGTFGDVSVFSLQAKKLVAAGQGGIMLTNDQEIYERANLLGHFKVRALQEVKSEKYGRFAGTGYGLNYRMHPLAAAIANTQLGRLESYIERRRENLEYLSEKLTDLPGIEPPTLKAHATRHVYYSYKPLYRPQDLGDLPIDWYIHALRHEGVPIEKSETRPLHMEPFFQTTNTHIKTHGVTSRFVDGGPSRVYEDGDLPGSERYADRALALPAYTEPARDVLDQFVLAFRKVAENLDVLKSYGERELGSLPMTR